MSKVKKLLALLTAGVMVMGMSVPAMAAGTATITVNNAGGATFNCVQIVQAAPNTETGWDIIDTYTTYFQRTNAFGNMSEQEILAGMIAAVDPDADKADEISGFDQKYAAALEAILPNVVVGTATSQITVNAAGVYFIKGNEDGYVFNPMAAYVAFGEYEGGVPTDLVDTSVTAKKEPTTITKTAEDENKVVEIGRTETYHVTAPQVPFVPLTDSNRRYIVKDTITGAEFVTVESGDHAGEIQLTVKIGTAPVGEEEDKRVTQTFYGTVTGNSFEANLSSILEGNQYQGQPIDVSYQAIVTDVKVSNTVQLGDGDNDGRFGTGSETLYTGEIELIKYASDNDNTDLTDNVKLANAKFIVYKTVTENEITKNKYATFDSNNKFLAWVDDESSADELTTDSNGKIKLEGLDLGRYYFKEVEAPTGYSINTTDVYVDLQQTGVATNIVTATPATMIDTELSALPGTGGIGTTIFTIGGCVIMIAAAGMFFATRKKEEQ